MQEFDLNSEYFNPDKTADKPNFQQELPNATTVLVLGIASLVVILTSFCCTFCSPVLGILASLVPLVTALIGFFMGQSSKKLYKYNAQEYTQSSYKNLNAGWILCVISLVICIAYIGLAIVIIALVGGIAALDSMGMDNYYNY